MYEGAPILEQDSGGLTLENAVLLAEAAHAGQLDKGDGGTYFRHPFRVMQALEAYGSEVQMAAVLHDVKEDGGITLEDLRILGASEDVIEAVDSVSKRDGESYDDAIGRVKQNWMGSLVKVADNRDNANKKRAALLPEDKRIKGENKYPKALAQLIEGNEWLAAQVPMIQARVEALFDAEQA